MKNIILLFILLGSISLWADLDFGKDLFNDQLYEEAISEFEKVVAYSPTSDRAQEAIFYIGKSYFERGQYSLAENSFKKITEGFPNNSFRDEVIFNLIEVQLLQKKYDDVILNSEEMLIKYPLSDFTKQALSLYLTALFDLQEYGRAIEKGQRFLKEYADSEYLPDVLLILAKIYFASNLADEGQKLLNRLFTEFPNQNAAWKAVELEVDLKEKSAGKTSAANLLAEKMKEDVPRLYEETLRLKLAKYYIDLENYFKANQELKNLIEKFSNSAHLDNYIILYSNTKLKLNNANQVIDDFAEFKKVFRESPRKSEYLLLIAEAYLMQNNVEKAEEFISNAKEINPSDENLYRSEMLQAKLSLKEGKLTSAISIYQNLLNSPFAEKNKILMQLGDIYYEQLADFSKAEKFYSRIITSYAPSDILNEALYKASLCLENLDENEKALEMLLQIDLESISDKEFGETIKSKIAYINKFKQQDYETAFDKLIQSIFQYTENNDKAKLKSELVTILSDDLKNYDLAMQILEDENSYKSIYTKAKLLLKLTEKYQAESKNHLVQRNLVELQDQMMHLDRQQHASWIAELNLKKALIEEQEVTSDLIMQLDDYIHNFPNGESVNEFRFELYSYYKNLKDHSRAATYAALLQDDGTVPKEGFFAAKVTLAEDYFNRDLHDQALRNYRIADSYIDMKKPLIYFHYAVTLNETGNTTEARDKLAFLINNAGYFNGFETVINYFCNILRSMGEYTKAIKYMKKLPEEYQNDVYWKQLAEDYLISGDVENGKYSLMRIVNKDYETLSRLGHLQYDSGEYEMAKYTFGELIDRNKNDLENYKILGQIAFIQEEFLEAAKNYKVIVNKLGENFSSFKGMRRIALENIISLYRIENRPKAERLTKTFKKLLSEQDINEIELNRGIYHIDLDKKKAIKIFSSLINGKKVNNSTRIKAYFWRGLVRLEQNNTEEAESDFSTVANSIDKEMSNKANLKLGTIKFSQEEYEEALDHYFQVIKNDEKGSLAFDAARNFAFVCKTIEEWQKAIAAYQIILERWGDQKLEGETLFDIAYCYYRDREFGDAAAMFARSTTLIEDEELKAEAQYWIGESYFSMEEFEQAVSEFLKVGYNYPSFTQWAASAELKAGEAYLKMNKKTKAIQMYERIIDKYGKYSQWGQEAEKRLGNL
ncbi:MAG: tetratricopeptide repeat protein [Candidatus Cloacimonetes bacterium]|nr:tetratricopeptide repeat protein [Candidatus Cloacimonadota bacterium]MCF7814395.1 tetratricopeptide repeat protein [Candidatus Cloacimonadota bacterium]MCF7868525.1 tetratricopeptide repeat protein [Candidatus Cloacimonadota bacterium]MCF7884055.1 tetratricopeptide repeat protein [Candidatus Cloacimonadota bacterium]